VGPGDEATLGGAWGRGHTGWGLGTRPHWVGPGNEATLGGAWDEATLGDV